MIAGNNLLLLNVSWTIIIVVTTRSFGIHSFIQSSNEYIVFILFPLTIIVVISDIMNIQYTYWILNQSYVILDLILFIQSSNDQQRDLGCYFLI